LNNGLLALTFIKKDASVWVRYIAHKATTSAKLTCLRFLACYTLVAKKNIPLVGGMNVWVLLFI
jgi:hypothetical protein